MQGAGFELDRSVQPNLPSCMQEKAAALRVIFVPWFEAANGTYQVEEEADLRYWHKTDIPADTLNVRYRGVKRT